LHGSDTKSTQAKPRPVGDMRNPADQTGFSDHFPAGMHVTETP
jgi:hypothetical protein